MKVFNSVLELVGRTPTVRLERYCGKVGARANIYAKLESFNPTGSAKDRVALAMIERAEKQGILSRGATIVEPTSGNTGIGLAMVGALKGYKVVLTMPETMSEERRKLLKAYGAEIVLTDGSKGMDGAVAKAKEIVASDSTAYMPQQFENSANPEVHYLTTGREIWEDMEGKVDIVVAGVGTGGTISGISKFLKEKGRVKAVAVEPYSSPLLSLGRSGKHVIQGIGANFIPSTLDRTLIDEIIAVKDEDAISTMSLLCRSEGIFGGVSSGAALFAASLLAKEEENEGKNIVVVLPDSGDRYLSVL